MLNPLRILIVEDSALDAELVVAELTHGGYDVTFTRVETAEAMAEALVSSTWDLVMSDHELPAFSGPAALALLQKTGLDLPFIVISGTIGEELAVGSLKAGADDFFIKGRLARLIPAIERERREVVQRREHQRAEEALRRSEADYRSLVDGAVFGIYRATIEGRFVTVNPALVAMLGCASADELIGIGLQNLYLDPAVPADLVRRSHERGRLEGEEVRWQRQNGTTIRVRLSGRLIDAHDASPALFEVIVEDITEQHRLYEQLRQAQKMEAIGRLASGVAHDFNNLLTVILGFTEFVTANVAAGSRNANDLAEIVKAAQRASGLTRQLLAFSRQQVLHAAPLDVNELITDMTGMLSRLIGEHIEIALALAPQVRLVMADRGQLEQVVMNLVVNARDAMPDGGVLTIESKDVTLDNSGFHEHEIVPGAYVMLAITDTGVGMTKETQRRLFEPFFTTKEAGRGTGLGLSTTYGIVKQSQGYIWVYSEPDHGTTFHVYLPRSPAHVAAAVETMVSSVVAPAVKHGRETVLLVEDDAAVRHLATRILDKAGFRVLEAVDGTDAEQIFAAHAQEVDLVVTDIVMPGCGGPELLARLQRLAPVLRVLYMSGYTEQTAVTKVGLDRGLPFVQKPFTASEFIKHVRNALDR